MPCPAVPYLVRGSNSVIDTRPRSSRKRRAGDPPGPRRNYFDMIEPRVFRSSDLGQPASVISMSLETLSLSLSFGMQIRTVIHMFSQIRSRVEIVDILSRLSSNVSSRAIGSVRLGSAAVSLSLIGRGTLLYLPNINSPSALCPVTAVLLSSRTPPRGKYLCKIIGRVTESARLSSFINVPNVFSFY